MTAVVCRENKLSVGTEKSSDPCDVVRRIAVAPGHAEATDVLPPDLSSGATTLLAYRIDLLNDHGRSAGTSDPVYAAGGKVPAPVGEITLSPRRGAALIQWRAEPAGSPQEATMEVRRSLVSSASTEKRASEDGTRTGLPVHLPAPALKAAARTSSSFSKEPQGEVILTAEKGADRAKYADPGGLLDPTVRDGDSYVYVAQRVKRVTLSGHDLEVRGVASPSAAFTFRGTFPPKVPSGLVSVPGAGFADSPSIDLSWEPNAESDLVGYNVYRRRGSGGFSKLNKEPVPSSSFRDVQVSSGEAYTYRVTAIDQQGNESAPSSEIQEILRK